MLGRNCYHQTSATLISDKMDLILKFFAIGAMVDCLDTSQEESFHISLPYINIITYFFEKIKKDFFMAIGLDLIPTSFIGLSLSQRTTSPT